MNPLTFQKLQVKYRAKHNPFYAKIQNRIHDKRQNVLILIQGPAGTGKSWAGCKIGYDNDPDFRKVPREEMYNYLKERVIRKPKQFIDLINSDKLKLGNWIMFDESGVGISNREWYTFQNKAVGRILQTFRNRRLLVIFTVPRSSLLDKQARDSFNFDVRCEHIDFSTRETQAKILEVSYHYHFQEMTRTFIGKKDPLTNEIHEYPHFRFSAPPKYITDAYEKYAIEFKKEIINELAQEAKLIAEAEYKVRPIDIEEIIKEIEENFDEMVSTYHSKPTIPIDAISGRFKISDHAARRMNAQIQHRLKDKLDKYMQMKAQE